MKKTPNRNNFVKNYKNAASILYIFVNDFLFEIKKKKRKKKTQEIFIKIRIFSNSIFEVCITF